eukprot:scaffold5524_cov64-Phaeocystis_antarctica.AAC.1
MPSLALACRSSSPQTSTQGVHREARGPEAPHPLTRGELSEIGMLVRAARWCTERDIVSFGTLLIGTL